MEFKAEARALSQVDADVLVVGIFVEDKVQEILATLDSAIPTEFISAVGEEALRESFTGKAGQTLLLPTFEKITAKRLLLRGLGKKAEYTAATARKAAGAVAKRLMHAGKVKEAAIESRCDGKSELLQAVVEGWLLGSYSFTKYKSPKPDEKKHEPAEAVAIIGSGLDQSSFNEALRRGRSVAQATNFARDLIAEPASYMTPGRLAEAAKSFAQADGVLCEVLEVADVEKLGMGSFLGVARGAKEPAKFIVMRYSHPDADKTVGLAGKGITFDSGGLSIKSAQGMENMKYDMSGAAAVIATMRVIGELKPKINVIAVAAATENMPGGAAMHPGDVLTAMNGKTIEVNNTDAEGRLVLADALAFLCKEKTTEIIDIATLTGAVVTALGRAAAGIMCNNEDFARRLIASGAEAGEKLWQLPLYDEYKETLKSDIADLKNAGAKGEAGSSSAAMFLQEFVDNRPWAHLDIAGAGWLDKEKDELNKGGTAFGVRTLCYYILSQAS